MGTHRVNRRGDERAAVTGPLKGTTGKLKGDAGRKDGFAGSGYSTGQLRLPPSRRRKTARLRRAVLALASLAFGAGVVAALSLMGASAFLDSLSPERRGLGAGELARGLVPLSERQAVLVLGTDIAYAGGQKLETGAVRSDTILVMGVDPAGHKLDVVSIPRDTRVLVRGRWDKINAAFYQGGPKLAADAVSELLGIPVRHWAQVNTSGLEKLVDVMGGVRLYVDKDMHYVDRTAGLVIDFKRGWNVLDGAKAHRYVRFRHDELGDIGRVQRQQQFMRAALERLLTPDTLLKVPRMLATVRENVRTNLSGPELVQLATWAARLDRKDVRLVMLPGQFSDSSYAASYWLADPAAARSIGRQLVGREAGIAGAPPNRGRVAVTVLNGTMRGGLATTAARELREAGWSIRAVGDAPFRGAKTTRVIAQTGHGEWTALLGKDLGLVPERVDASVGDIMSDFTVVVGEDYAAELGLAAR